MSGSWKQLVRCLIRGAIEWPLRKGSFSACQRDRRECRTKRHEDAPEKAQRQQGNDVLRRVCDAVTLGFLSDLQRQPPFYTDQRSGVRGRRR